VISARVFSYMYDFFKNKFLMLFETAREEPTILPQGAKAERNTFDSKGNLGAFVIGSRTAPICTFCHIPPIFSKFIEGGRVEKSSKSRFSPPKWHFPIWGWGLSLTCILRVSSKYIDILSRRTPLFLFFLSWVSKTQPYH